MDFHSPRFTRRNFLQGLSAGLFATPLLQVFTEEHLRFLESGAYADELTRTPAMTEGPFYPDKMPLDTDNDLVILGKGKEAVGDVTHLTGRILDTKGDPIKNATIEIWQVDHHGAYLHTGSGNSDKRDKNFQGFGRFETASDGKYKFRTIKPVPYPGRTPHIHVKVLKGDRELLCTQCFVKGHPQNARDGILLSMSDPKVRNSVVVAFDPLKGSKVGELGANFDIVIGYTPEDRHEH